MKQFKPILWTVGALAIIALAAVFIISRNTESGETFISAFPSHIRYKLDRREIAQALASIEVSSENIVNDAISFAWKHKNYQAKLTIDKELQTRLEEIYERYDPAYAAFVAMDPETGKILALVDHSSEDHEGNLALQASFPAASIFKVVTSAAALEEKKLAPGSRISFNGSYSSLYKRNIQEHINRWTRFISVEEALAKSVNTVFAKIAVHRLGAKTLQKYANAFGFNQQINFDMPVDVSSALIPEDSFGLAESGSGYTRRQTLSLLQGALMASSIINGGEMPNPQLVEKVQDEAGNTIYQNKNKVISQPLDRETAHALSLMMENTITRGTARSQYRDYNHHPVLSRLFIGAKTGSLSGDNPEGRYDWFVGFAKSSENPKRKIAFASLIINKKFWRVKAAHVAREAILDYFGRKTAL